MHSIIWLLLFAPPCIACVWWLLSRGWATIVQGGSVSERTVKRQRIEFWIMLVAAYVVAVITSLVEHKL
jgi:hypothetical protein